MRRAVAVVSLMLLSGCGSCIEDKTVPEPASSSPPVKTVVMKTEDGGVRRPAVVVGEPIDFAGVLDAGR